MARWKRKKVGTVAKHSFQKINLAQKCKLITIYSYPPYMMALIKTP